jgi:ABC-2 type transport system permease protein
MRVASRADAERALSDKKADALLTLAGIRSRTTPAKPLVGLLQAANREARAPASSEPPPLAVSTIERPDPARDRRGGLAFFVVLILYGQLLTYGIWVASGVVEEKSSRVIEVLLATIRPRELLAGKVIGLGLLGLAQLLVISVLGLGVARAAGKVPLDGDVLAAAGFGLIWFLLGYGFYACAFACAGSLVPRLEELQSATTPLVLVILVSMFVAFGANAAPDGTLAHVSAFIPMTAPLTLPSRILVGEAPWTEVLGGAVVTLAASAALIPLAARIYAGAVLRTGSAVGLRDAWRSSRRP